MNIKTSLLTALCFILSLKVYAGDWEIKTDVKYTDGAISDVISYESNGDFDKRKVKHNRKAKLDTLFTYSDETALSGLDYKLRFGQLFERNKKYSVQLKQNGQLKKNKSLTEYERITYAGIGGRYHTKQLLGADRWIIKAYYDQYIHIDYGSSDRQKHAKSESGELNNGYEFEVGVQGEYSTPWMSLYLQPFLTYKEEYRGGWLNEPTGDWKAEEREEQYEAGLYISWIPSIAGLEWVVGPYWQKERDYERESGADWESEDKEQWVARLKLEYESPLPGFEMEFVFEHSLNGEDEGERVYNMELSYEF